MNKIKFEDFFLLLNEWKDIVDGTGSDLSVRENAKLKIDKIIDELKKPQAERNVPAVELAIEELKNEKGIKKYVESSSKIIIELCYNSN